MGALYLGVQDSTPRNSLPWERDSQPPVQSQEPPPREGGALRRPVMDSRRSLESAAHLQHLALHTDCCCHEQGHRPAPAAQQCQTQTCLAKVPSPRDFSGHRCMPGSFPRRPAARSSTSLGASGVSTQKRSRFYPQQTLNPSLGPPTSALPRAARGAEPNAAASAQETRRLLGVRRGGPGQ